MLHSLHIIVLCDNVKRMYNYVISLHVTDGALKMGTVETLCRSGIGEHCAVFLQTTTTKKETQENHMTQNDSKDF